MTNVRIFISNNIYRGFSLSGHAGFADSGEDIVCAALSVLSTSCSNSIEALANQIPRVDMDEESGTLSVMFDFEPNEKTVLFVESFKLAIEQLVEVYGDYVSYEIIYV